MSGLQRVIGSVTLVVTLATLAGVLVRSHYRAAAAFTAYLAVIFTTDFLMTGDVVYGLWPGRFYTRQFWLAKQVAVTALRFAAAFELAYRTFKGFPGAEATLRRTLLVALVATYAAVVVAVPAENPTYPTLIAELEPRVANGTVWILTAISALVLWYRLPLASFHKAILIGFAPWLMVSTVARNILASREDLRAFSGHLETGAYAMMMIYWCQAAWRPVAETVHRAPVLAVGAPSLRPTTSQTSP